MNDDVRDALRTLIATAVEDDKVNAGPPWYFVDPDALAAIRRHSAYAPSLLHDILANVAYQCDWTAGENGEPITVPLLPASIITAIAEYLQEGRL